jgi:hypothetical protein
MVDRYIATLRDFVRRDLIFLLCGSARRDDECRYD